MPFVLFFVKTLMKHSKLTAQKKRKETHGAVVNVVLHELQETAQLILWETTSDCHNQGKVTLLGKVMKVQ